MPVEPNQVVILKIIFDSLQDNFFIIKVDEAFLLFFAFDSQYLLIYFDSQLDVIVSRRVVHFGSLLAGQWKIQILFPFITTIDS